MDAAPRAVQFRLTHLRPLSSQGLLSFLGQVSGPLFVAAELPRVFGGASGERSASAPSATEPLPAEPETEESDASFVVICLPAQIAPGAELKMGRSSQCEIHIPLHATISRVHARLRRSGDVITIEDNGSRNGTYVDGERILPGEPAVLKEGSLVVLGDFGFRFLNPEGLYRKLQPDA